MHLLSIPPYMQYAFFKVTLTANVSTIYIKKKLYIYPIGGVWWWERIKTRKRGRCQYVAKDTLYTVSSIPSPTRKGLTI